VREFDSQKAIEAQAMFAKAREYPHFAPSDGICYNCGSNIYVEIIKGNHRSGIDVERASTSLITGCPHCHWSYCE